ncbi:MAG: protein kinase [Okeania sp. SIO3C4]|nr:protein kinase [Okeania sp. SIO3C4]
MNTILNNRYEIIRQLGQGNFGTTYLAKDNNLPKSPVCVVKKLSPVQTEKKVLSEANRLFYKEAEALQKLGEHNQIPRLLAYFEENSEFYLVQEFIEGHDLTKEICTGKQFSETKTIKLLIDILQVLNFVHQNNVVHRDLKPQNIMRRASDGQIVLIDFGAVKEVEKIGEKKLGTSIGSPGYMPREQAIGQPKFCSDIYAVGMIGILALTGDINCGGVVIRNERLKLILDKMTCESWQKRYQTVDDVLAELKDLGLSMLKPQKTVLSTSPNRLQQLEQEMSKPTVVQDNKWRKALITGLTATILTAVPAAALYFARPFLFNERDTSALLNEDSKPEVPKAEVPKPEEQKPDVSQPEVLKPEEPKLEEPKPLSEVQSTSSSLKLARVRTFEGHRGTVYAVVISPDGQTIVSGSADTTIKVWDYGSGELKHSLTGHRGYIYTVAISPDGKTIVSGSSDDTVKVWDLTTGALLKTLSGHRADIYDTAISPDGQTVVSGSIDKTVKFWNLRSDELLGTITGYKYGVTSVDFVGEDIMAADIKTIKVWEPKTGLLKSTLATGGKYADVMVGMDDKQIIGTSNGAIAIWNSDSTTPVILPGDKYQVDSIVTTSDNIFAGRVDGSIQVWDLANKNLVTSFSGYHSNKVKSLAVTADGKTLVSGSADKTVKIWDLNF